MRVKITLVAAIIFVSSLMVFGENDKQSSIKGEKFLPTIFADKDNSISVSSKAQFDAPVCQCSVSYQGRFAVNGKLSVKNGPVSLIMWTRVDGKYYFSKLPELMTVDSLKEVQFSFPFDAAKKTADLIVLELIMPIGGKASISDLSHQKQE